MPRFLTAILNRDILCQSAASIFTALYSKIWILGTFFRDAVLWALTACAPRNDHAVRVEDGLYVMDTADGTLVRECNGRLFLFSWADL